MDPGPITQLLCTWACISPGGWGPVGERWRLRQISHNTVLSSPVFQHPLLCPPRWCPRDAAGRWAPACWDTVAHLCSESQSLSIISALGTRAELFEFQNFKAGPLTPMEVSGSPSAPLSSTSTFSCKPMGSQSRKSYARRPMEWQQLWSEECEGKSDPDLGL